jgi:hypothetical protein
MNKICKSWIYSNLQLNLQDFLSHGSALFINRSQKGLPYDLCTIKFTCIAKNTRALLRLDFYLLEHEAKLHKQIVRFVKNHKCYLCSCLASNITDQQCTYTRPELPEYQLGEESEQPVLASRQNETAPASNTP